MDTTRLDGVTETQVQRELNARAVESAETLRSDPDYWFLYGKQVSSSRAAAQVALQLGRRPTAVLSCMHDQQVLVCCTICTIELPGGQPGLIVFSAIAA